MKRAVIVALAVALAVIALAKLYSLDADDKYGDAFTLDAVFYSEREELEISFNDSTGGASKVTMQILGLKEPFLREYAGSAFTDGVKFEAEPKYGWKAHPIVVRFEHTEYGAVGIKTEAHRYGNDAPRLVYESP